MSLELLVGCYTPPMGDGRGIYRLSVAADGTGSAPGLVALTESPSFLIGHEQVVYVANEADQGRVTSFRRAGAELQQVSVQNTGGAHPCHLAVDPTGTVLAAANYTSGSVSVHRITDGRIEPAAHVLGFTGSGPVTERQDAAHAHQVVFANGLLLVVDLGSDRIWRHRLDAEALTVTALEPLVLPAGFGPRQLLVDGDYAYVLGELSNQLAVFAAVEASAPIKLVPAYGAELPDGNLAAALEPAGPNRFLVSHRGADRIVEFGYDGGSVDFIREFSSEGRGPRHLVSHDGTVMVADQFSDEVVIRTADGRVSRVAIPAPTCLLPLS